MRERGFAPGRRARLERLEDRCLLAESGPAVSGLLGTGEILGTKWNDLDGDGAWDAGEPGLPGVTIYLDLNENGQPDPGEPTAVTLPDDPGTPEDEAGTYAFRGLDAGNYTVAELLLDGWTQTFPAADGNDPSPVEDWALAGEAADAAPGFQWTGWQQVSTLSSGSYAADLHYGFTGTPSLEGAATVSSVVLEGEKTWVSSGDPIVPVRTSAVLLPQGTTIASVVADYGEGVTLGTGLRMAAAPSPQPISPSSEPAEGPVETVYAASFPGPQPIVYATHIVAGYSVAMLSVFPICYKAATGTLTYYPDLSARVTTKPIDPGGMLPVRDSAEDRARVADMVDNDSVLAGYVPDSGFKTADLPEDGPYEYVIVTSQSLAPQFQPLVDQKASRGLTAGIVTTETIYSSYTGTETHDNADKIREFIADAYANWNTRWILLGGDVDVVPQRGAYGLVPGLIDDTEDANIPTDLYYAALDGPWNSDGDAIWGESNDGLGGADVDLAADVYVGRAPVSTQAEAINFVGKTIQYETTPPPNGNTAVMLGEKLADSPLTYGSYSMIPIREDCFPADWTFIERYDSAGGWSGADLIGDLNASPHIVNHLGHADWDYNARLDNQQVDGLTNVHPYFMYSQGCYSGAFDRDDSIAEHHVLSENGAFAVVMNSRYGWYAPGDTPDASHYWHYEFWDAVFKENKIGLGEAHEDAKADNLWRVGGTGVERWIHFELTLFGDPETDFQLYQTGPGTHTVDLGTGQTAEGVDFGNHTNYAPVAADDEYDIGDETSYTVPAPGVLGNDTDANGDALVAERLAGPYYGELTFATDGSFTYTPGAGFRGSDFFTYRASDAQAESSPATVTIAGTPMPNTPPVAQDDAYDALSGKPLLVSSPSTQVAQCGFNDVAGINADDLPHSPYQIGTTVHGRGALEPGWGAAWVVNAGGMEIAPSLGMAEADGPAEGDGLLHILPSPVWGETWVYRPMAEALAGEFLLEQSVRLPSDGMITSRPGLGGSPEVIGPMWRAVDGAFYAFDGDGTGQGTFEDTGFTWLPDQWYKVSLRVDPAAQTYRFFVDDVEYVAPDPLGFRGGPTSIRIVEYLARSHAWIDAIQVTSLDPSRIVGVLGNDTDAENDRLTAVLVDGPAHGTLSLWPDGTFGYTAEPGYVGTDTFTYKANDGQADSGVATVTLTVTMPPNTAPVAADDAYEVETGTTLSVSAATRYLAQCGFNDQAGIHSDPLPYSPYEMGATVHGRGTLEPGWGETWQVLAGGQYVIPSLAIAESADPLEGDGVLHIMPTAIYRETWVFRWLAEPQYEEILIEQYVRLGEGGLVMSRPGLGGSGNLIGPQWKAEDGNFYAYDGDGHGGGTYEPTGFTWLPDQWNKVSVRVDASEQKYEFYVNDQRYISPDPLNFRGNPPSIQFIEYLTSTHVWVDSVQVTPADPGQPVGLLANDTDAEDDPLTAILVSGPSHGTLALNADGTFTYTPEDGYVGDDSFTYRASDGLADSGVATATVAVTPPANKPPVVEDDYYEVDAGSTLVVENPTSWIAQSGFNDQAGAESDPVPGQPYEFEATVNGRGDSEPGWADPWSATAGGSGGYLRGTCQGDDPFEGDGVLFMIPGGGDTWVHRSLAEPQSGPVLIEQIIRLPASGICLSRPGMGGIASLVGPMWKAEAGGFYAYDGDGAGGGTWEFTGLTYTPMQWHKVSVLADAGTQQYRFFVDDREYKAPDPLNFRGSPEVISFIDYLPQTDTWVDLVRVTPDDPTRVLGVLGNDVDREYDRMTAVLVDGPAHGTLSLEADGTFTYTPSPSFNGIDHFTYKASDGTQESNVATVTITVPPNLDIDANGEADALTDGILILRYLFGFTGAALTEGAIDPSGNRTDPADVVPFLNNCRDTMLDVDANGQADALTDGILILRHLFGFTGTALVEDALAPDATRTDPADIVAFLDQFRPGIAGAATMAPLGAAADAEGVVDAQRANGALPGPQPDRGDAVWADSSSQPEDDWLGVDRARRAALYRALAIDAIQTRVRAKREPGPLGNQPDPFLLLRDGRA